MALIQNKRARCAICLCFAVVLTACTLRKPHFPGPLPHDGALQDFLDVQPGYRIRVVTPVLKSGGYKPQITTAPMERGVVVFTTTDEFVGYETSYYAVKGWKGGGIRIRFTSAWVSKQGKTIRASDPRVQLFDFPGTMKFVRLIYTIRASQADHDMAILAASDLQQLNDLTARIRTGPAAACHIFSTTFCEWVPQGIGIQIGKSQSIWRDREK